MMGAWRERELLSLTLSLALSLALSLSVVDDGVGVVGGALPLAAVALVGVPRRTERAGVKREGRGRGEERNRNSRHHVGGVPDLQR